MPVSQKMGGFDYTYRADDYTNHYMNHYQYGSQRVSINELGPRTKRDAEQLLHQSFDCQLDTLCRYKSQLEIELNGLNQVIDNIQGMRANNAKTLLTYKRLRERKHWRCSDDQVGEFYQRMYMDSAKMVTHDLQENMLYHFSGMAMQNYKVSSGKYVPNTIGDDDERFII